MNERHRGAFIGLAVAIGICAIVTVLIVGMILLGRAL